MSEENKDLGDKAEEAFENAKEKAVNLPKRPKRPLKSLLKVPKKLLIKPVGITKRYLLES